MDADLGSISFAVSQITHRFFNYLNQNYLAPARFRQYPAGLSPELTQLESVSCIQHDFLKRDKEDNASIQQTALS